MEGKADKVSYKVTSIIPNAETAFLFCRDIKLKFGFKIECCTDIAANSVPTISIMSKGLFIAQHLSVCTLLCMFACVHNLTILKSFVCHSLNR